MALETSALFVGMGSPHGDDQIGWLVADRLREQVPPLTGVLIRRAIVPIDLVDWLDGFGHLYVCDACKTGAPLGELRRWDWPFARHVGTDDLWAFDDFGVLRSTGTHDCGLGQVLCVARKLNWLPSRVTVWGIEAAEFEPNSPLSEQLRNAIPRIVDTILQELSNNRERQAEQTQGDLISLA